ncbi:unnamed protein product, partial [Discosporangium mesarthrocarpum]
MLLRFTQGMAKQMMVEQTIRQQSGIGRLAAVLSAVILTLIATGTQAQENGTFRGINAGKFGDSVGGVGAGDCVGDTALSCNLRAGVMEVASRGGGDLFLAPGTHLVTLGSMALPSGLDLRVLP